jgi:hypothetical protein
VASMRDCRMLLAVVAIVDAVRQSRVQERSS